jgi:hypothetical protein
MRTVILGVLLVAICALWASEHSKSAQIAKLENDLHAIKSTSAAANLETQGKCARQAQVAFTEAGWKRSASVDYTNHYNAELNKCFIEITNNEIEHGQPSRSILLADAFEEKEYGSYLWINSQGKKWWEVSPLECEVTLISGEKQHCASSEEFDKLVNTYMQ